VTTPREQRRAERRARRRERRRARALARDARRLEAAAIRERRELAALDALRLWAGSRR